MAKDIVIDALLEGGKASGGPPLGPAIGPTGINIMAVVKEINERTTQYSGMKVPVRITLYPESKTWDIEISTPPTSALIFKELGIEKGSSKPNEDKVGDLTIAQAVNVANAKGEAIYARTLKAAVKTVLGTCVSAGITVEGQDPRVIQKQIDAGEYDKELGV